MNRALACRPATQVATQRGRARVPPLDRYGGARLAVPELGPGGRRVTLIEKLPERLAGRLPVLPVGNRNLAVILGSTGIGLAARCLLV